VPQPALTKEGWFFLLIALRDAQGDNIEVLNNVQNPSLRSGQATATIDE